MESRNKTFKTLQCRQCDNKVERVDQHAVSVLCYKCTLITSRGCAGETEDDIFSLKQEDLQINSSEE